MLVKVSWCVFLKEPVATRGRPELEDEPLASTTSAGHAKAARPIDIIAGVPHGDDVAAVRFTGGAGNTNTQAVSIVIPPRTAKRTHGIPDTNALG